MSVDNRQLPVRRALSPTTGLIVLTVAVIAATVWSYRYFGKYSPYASLLSQQNNTLPQITLTIQNPRISVRSGGHRRLLASARQVSFSRDSRTVFVDNIHDGILFDDSGKPQVDFDAGQMTYNTPSGDIATTVGSTIQLNQGIHATIIRPSTTARSTKSTGPHISTNVLTWNATTGEVKAPGDVTIDFANHAGTGTARDVVYNTHSHNLSVQHVHGTFHASKLVQ